MAEITAANIEAALKKQLDALNTTVDTREVGTVIQVGDGIARVEGLRDAMAGELLEFVSASTGKKVYGLAQNLEEEEVGAVLLGDVSVIKENDEVHTTGRILEIPVSRGMLGRVVNPLGEPIDGLGPIEPEGYRPIEFKAPGVMARKGVCEPVQTGLIAVDAMIPIGRGQRELIIGDRKTGKTAIGIDTIINQKNENMICVYVAIGQKASTVAAIRETLEKYGALDYTIIVSASASDAAPLQFIAPMAGAAIGEYFMYNGKDGKPANAENPGGHVLCVYDDLSKQAVAYRQMSLTLNRPPGREAYPGDIFYLHSRLLERAVKLNEANGCGLADRSAHHRDAGRRHLGLHPDERDFDHRRSDLPADRHVLPGPAPRCRRGPLGLARRRFGPDQVDEAVRRQPAPGPRLLPRAARPSRSSAATSTRPRRTQLTRGSRMTELLKQGRYQPMDVADQVIAIFAGVKGFLDDLAVEQVVPFRKGLLDYMHATHPEFNAQIKAGKVSDELAAQMADAIKAYHEQFVAESQV